MVHEDAARLGSAGGHPSDGGNTLITRLSFPYLLQQSGRNGAQVTWFDLYARSHGVLTTLVARVFGVSRVSRWIERIGRWMRVKLSPVPHGVAVPDYHRLQLLAERRTHQLLATHSSAFAYEEDALFPDLEFDPECLRSRHIQDVGTRLLPIVENLMVLQARGITPTLRLDRHELPDRFVPIWAEEFGIEIETAPRTDAPLVALLGLLFAGRAWLQALLGLLRRESVADDRRVAVEFVDPSCCGERPTEPAFLLRAGFSADEVVAYVRPRQARLHGRDSFSLPDIPVVHLLDLPTRARDVQRLLGRLLKALGRSVRGRYSPNSLHRHIEDIVLHFWLDILLRRPSVHIHVYNTIPNGKTNTRSDTGLVTAACRRSGVMSASYQSRVMYRRNVYYSFQALDLLCYWGQTWVEEFSSDQFIRSTATIGNVSPVFHRTAESSHDSGGHHNVVVFTGDMDFEEPLHYTFDYNKRFFLDCLGGLRNLPDPYRILLKTKDLGQANTLLDDEEVAQALQVSGIEVVPMAKLRHDLAETMQLADVVLALGFTTPGFDALCSGIPARYYTPYDDCYVGAFEGDSPLVVRSKSDIARFMREGTEVPPHVLAGLDPHRDGRAAERLGEVLRSHPSPLSGPQGEVPGPT